MITDVKLKIRMRTRALLNSIALMAKDNAAWNEYVDNVVVRCGHPNDWRCLMAHIVQREHPGCTIRVGSWIIMIDLPVLYKGSERTVQVQMVPEIRHALMRVTPTDGTAGQPLTSCAVMPIVSLPSTRTRQRGKN